MYNLELLNPNPTMSFGEEVDQCCPKMSKPKKKCPQKRSNYNFSISTKNK